MHKPLYARLYVQVLTAIVIGALLGNFFPAYGVRMQPLGEGFIKLIRMMIAPIIFGTVVVGIAKMGDMKKVGRVGLKTLVYFEVVTTVALVIGLIVVNVLQPGVGVTTTTAPAASTARGVTTVEFLLNIIPTTIVDAFAKGDILQVLFFSVLFGAALALSGSYARPVVDLIDRATHALFRVIGFIMHLAPIGAFGAMAFVIGQYGIGSLTRLAWLMAGVYITCLVFVFAVLGAIARATGFSLLRFLAYIKEEILIVLGTSSSESVLPRMIAKLENAGCDRTVVGLAIPTGYSFNLDGTSIYLTMAAVFIAQANGIELSIGQQLQMLAVLLLTSKGAAAVTGGGFITLAATLSAIGLEPGVGLALLLGVDRFMSEARAITNLIGNGVATIVVARWEGALDEQRLAHVLSAESDADAEEPEKVLETLEPEQRRA
jgi:aerobic C4-dicarboxylate transport protein